MNQIRLLRTGSESIVSFLYSFGYVLFLLFLSSHIFPDELGDILTSGLDAAQSLDDINIGFLAVGQLKAVLMFLLPGVPIRCRLPLRYHFV